MHLVPFKINDETYNLFIVLEEKNITRMKGYDPAQVNITKMPPEWLGLKLGTIIIGYGTKEDIKQFEHLLNSGAPAAALEWLSRGFAFRPREGDNDEAYRRPQ